MQKEAVFAVQNILKDESDPILAMEYILNAITKKIEISNAQGSVVNKDMIETVVAELSRNEDDISNDSISVVSAFDLPTVKYSAVTKGFTLAIAQKIKVCTDQQNLRLLFTAKDLN